MEPSYDEVCKRLEVALSVIKLLSDALLVEGKEEYEEVEVLNNKIPSNKEEENSPPSPKKVIISLPKRYLTPNKDSGYVAVYRTRRGNDSSWQALLRHKGVTMSAGSFNKPEYAALAVNLACRYLYNIDIDVNDPRKLVTPKGVPLSLTEYSKKDIKNKVLLFKERLRLLKED